MTPVLTMLVYFIAKEVMKSSITSYWCSFVVRTALKLFLRTSYVQLFKIKCHVNAFGDLKYGASEITILFIKIESCGQQCE